MCQLPLPLPQCATANCGMHCVKDNGSKEARRLDSPCIRPPPGESRAPALPRWKGNSSTQKRQQYNQDCFCDQSVERSNNETISPSCDQLLKRSYNSEHLKDRSSYRETISPLQATTIREALRDQQNATCIPQCRICRIETQSQTRLHPAELIDLSGIAYLRRKRPWDDACAEE